jgi:iron(III) transport system permease protein
MTTLPITPSVEKPKRASRILAAEGAIMRGATLLSGTFLVIFVLLPLWELIRRSLENRQGEFVGIQNYVDYFATPALAQSFTNSLYISAMSTLITVVLAFIFAYALTRTCMPFKGVLRTLALLPIFAPSLLHGIAFIYLFGNQGIFTNGVFNFFLRLFGGYDIRNVPIVPFEIRFNIDLYKAPTGIIFAEVFYLFPHVLLILMVALSLTDGRLYEAATALRTPRWRTFLTVTLPSVRYGLISACFVAFTLVITDFGIPKVIGDGVSVLATDIYKQVIGQQNFFMGSTVSVLLLTPTIIGFVIDRIAQRRQVAMLTSRTVPYQPKPNRALDWTMFAICAVIVGAILLVIGTALLASLVNVWPYRLELSGRHYDFSKVAGGGLTAYWNSLLMAGLTAVFGTATVFVSAYFIEKGQGLKRARALLYFLSTLPVALPGLVLGLAYIFFFNRPSNPLNFIYGTMPILVLSTIVHFYTVSFFTATTALKQIDKEFEAVSASLSVPFYRTFWRVTLPVSLPAILEIAIYYFVNALTTVSAVIFLYSANLKLAAVLIVNMDDAGDTAPAAAMSMLLFFTGIGVRLLYELVTRGIKRRSQAWRAR